LEGGEVLGSRVLLGVLLGILQGVVLPVVEVDKSSRGRGLSGLVQKQLHHSQEDLGVARGLAGGCKGGQVGESWGVSLPHPQLCVVADELVTGGCVLMLDGISDLGVPVSEL